MYNFFLKNISFEEEISEILPKMCTGVYVKNICYSYQILTTLSFSHRFFKSLNYQI